jgi:hypothetical protein
MDIDGLDIDLTEAVEAAAIAVARRDLGIGVWDRLSPSRKHQLFEAVTPLVVAAAPHIVLQLAERLRALT